MARTQTTLILTRDARLPAPALETPQEVRVAHVRSAGDEGFAEIDAMCRAHGFPEGWVAAMIAAGAEAFAAIRAQVKQPQAVAAAWLTRNPFYVDEIGCTFTAAPEGDYYFGDFVEPAWRGRKLQRLLIHHRLAASHATGRLWAFAMMRQDNAPSLRSYQAEQFHAAARLGSMRIARWRLDRLHPVNPDLPHGWIYAPGWELPFSLRWSRR